jgi:NAD(P)-dependent dehydrogenase (short-subunit alcohol dehydrogenase family)
MDRFVNKVVVVTGAGAGLGRSVAEEFAQEGAALVLADVNEANNLETRDIVTSRGGTAIAVTTDVSNRKSVDELVARAVAEFRRIDVAINNAGVDEPPGPFLDSTDESFDRIMGVNLRGMWLCMQAEIRAMLPHAKGAIVNVTSISDQIGPAFVRLYVASKHGALGLTQSAAIEFAQSGIRINAVAPGGMMTPMIAEVARLNPEFVKQGNAAHPIGRIADPREVARAILFLASDDASFIVGHSLKVDGGYTVV